jgi:hypothetical protein
MTKTNPLFLLIGVLAIAFVVLIISSSSGVVPYDSKMRNYAEAMSTLEPKSESVPVSTKQSGNTSVSSENGIMSAVSNMLPSFGTENFEPMVDEPKSVQYGPFRDSEIIDRFSQVTSNGMDGVNGCVSSGLSNAGGYICLTPDLIQMLKTRGGNAKGT